MKKPRFILGITAVITTVLLIFGCTKEQYNFNNVGVGSLNWDPSLAAPLVNSRLSLDDFLSDSATLIVQDPSNNSLTLVYSGDVFSQVASDIFTIPDQSTGFDITLPIPPILIPGDSIIVPTTIQESFSLPAGDLLDSLSFKAGVYEIALTADLNHDALVKVTSNDILLNGQPFETTLIYQYAGSVPLTVSNSFNLNNFKFIFDNTGIDTNIINLNIEVTTYITNNPINPTPYTLNFSNSFTDLEFKSLFGELNTQQISLDEDSVEIPLFNSNIKGSFNLDDPQVKITFGNSFGLPVSIDMSNFASYSQYNAPYQVNLAGPGIPSPFILNSPNYQLIGQSVQTFLDLDKNNSNIDAFVNISPDLIIYKIDGELNPYGPGTKTFVLDTSRLDVSVDIEVPLTGAITNFVLQDTFDFGLGDIEDIFGVPADFFEELNFKVNIDNGFPLDVAVQAYFADSLGNVKDSLFNSLQTIIAAAPAGPAPDYKSTTTTHKMTDVVFPQSKIKAIEDAQKLIVKGKIVTSDDGNSNVRVYSDYFIDFKLGVKTKINAELN